MQSCFVLTMLLLGSTRGQLELLAQLEVAWAHTSAPPAVAGFTSSLIELRDGPLGHDVDPFMACLLQMYSGSLRGT